MAKVQHVFPMTNPHTQHNSRSLGICTAKSLAWCRASLKNGGRINSASMLPSDHVLNAQMAVLRQYDHDPGQQAEKAGLELVRSWNVTSLDEVFEHFKSWAPHIGVFWTDGHTMGYSYAHHDKEFFDVESGLYRGKKTADIRAQITAAYPADSIRGCYMVKLPS